LAGRKCSNALQSDNLFDHCDVLSIWRYGYAKLRLICNMKDWTVEKYIPVNENSMSDYCEIIQ